MLVYACVCSIDDCANTIDIILIVSWRCIPLFSVVYRIIFSFKLQVQLMTFLFVCLRQNNYGLLAVSSCGGGQLTNAMSFTSYFVMFSWIGLHGYDDRPNRRPRPRRRRRWWPNTETIHKSFTAGVFVRMYRCVHRQGKLGSVTLVWRVRWDPAGVPMNETAASRRRPVKPVWCVCLCL